MNTFLSLLGFDISPITAIESIKFSSGWGWAGVLLAAIIVLPIFVFSYRLEDKPCSKALYRLLLSLRVSFVICLLLLLAGFRCTISGWVPQKNKLALAIDTSRSMSINEDGLTRLDRIHEALGNGRLIQKLESRTGISTALFAFSDSVAPLSREDVASFGLTAEGAGTNITRAVTEITNHLGEGNLLGIVMLTDGAHNTGDNPLDVLAHSAVPLYFLGTGRLGRIIDSAIVIDRPPSIGYLNSMVRIRGELRAQGIASNTISITIKRDGKVFSSIEVPVNQQQISYPFAVDLPCEVEGAFKYSFSVPKVEGELTYENNETGFLLRVVKERLKIVILSGAPRWDQAFIRAAARGDPNAGIYGWTRVAEDRWLPTVDGKLQSGTVKPDLEDIEDADVLVLAGVAASVLEPVSARILERVESGKLGVLILAGLRGYAEIGYSESKLKALFPVELSGESWSGTPCNLMLPARDTPYAFLRLLDDPVENQEFFASLPKWEGLFTYVAKKSGAEVLLSSSLERNGNAQPALLAQRVGKGNVAMLCGGPIWPMGFTQVPTERTIRPFTAFIVNMIKWLANRREDSQVSLELPSSRGFVGQAAVVRVWVSDDKRHPLEAAQVSAQLTPESGEPMPLNFTAAAEKGCYESSFVPPARGLYTITAKALYKGASLGEARTQFLVETPTIEFDNPAVQVELMSKLASMTGGLYCPLESQNELLEAIKPKPGKKRESKAFDLQDSGVVLLFLLLLPLAEWTIRRIRGFS